MLKNAVPEVTRMTLIRHGETAWNAQTRIQGHLDIGLNETGRRQVQQVAAALSGEVIDAVLSSDLLRAADTAQAIARPHGLTVQTDCRLRERCFGCFQGMTYAEIEAQIPQQAARWRKRDPDFAPDGGESLLVFRDRIVQAFAAMAREQLGRHVVVVCHGGVLDVVYRAATGLGLQAPRTWQLGNASINRVLCSGEHLTLVGWSDTRHLTALLDEPHA